MADIENRKRRALRKSPLSPLLRGSDYITRCIVAATVEDKYRATFPANTEGLLEILKRLKPGLSERLSVSEAEREIDPIVQGIRMLQELFLKPEVSKFQIIAAGVESKMKSLIQMASEFDEFERTDLA